MLILKTQKDINNQILTLKKGKKKIGFVPTMGALHEGHLSLIKRSKQENEVTVCSIFVNPTQFNDKKDFEKYPITIEKDIVMLLQAKCDILFLPNVAEMYPSGFKNTEKIDFGFIAETLEGEHRPGHFDGMAQIVERLLRAVNPDSLYMGQKDYQQAMICDAMIRARKLKVKLCVCDIVREKDGLAMSSRNVRLDTHSRKLAVEISKTLKKVKSQVASRKSLVTSLTTDNRQPTTLIKDLEEKAFKSLAKHPEFKVEYLVIRDAQTLKPIRSIKKDKEMVALVACWIGGVRLIDNMLF